MARFESLLPHQIAKALQDAGVIADIDSIMRIVIDIEAGRLPQVYVQRIGDERLLGIVPMLAEAQVIERPKAVRYWVQVADDLMRDVAFSPVGWSPGLRPVRPDEMTPPPDAYSRWWLFEDDGAPPELDGKKVELAFEITALEPPRIVERRVIS